MCLCSLRISSYDISNYEAIYYNRQTSNIRRTLLGNKIVDHADLVGAFSNYTFIFDLTPGFNGLGKDNCKTRQKSFKLCNLMRLMLNILRYVLWILWQWLTSIC